MFNFIKNKLQKIYDQVCQTAHRIFSRTHIDQATVQELEQLLISADTGFKTTAKIIAELKSRVASGSIAHGQDLKKAVEQLLLDELGAHTIDLNSRIFMLVGINGSGKTTCAGKLAYQYTQQGKKVLLVAADTFRAAAPEQLAQWAHQTNADLCLGKPGQDPAAVVFQGCAQFKQNEYDIIIIDTAGRLQTKVNLMRELEKIKKVVAKQLPQERVITLLTIDAMLGQNSFEQARLFNESTHLDGIILTKMDGTGKGGIVCAITKELNIPIAYISFGEQLNDYKLFHAHEYVKNLFESPNKKETV